MPARGAASLVTAAAEGLQRLIETSGTTVPPTGFDNRPTWDNPTPAFDNRPTWDNWQNK
ncbi:multiple cyclophane-containing RiPP AmcA [Streptomyces sp. NPDC058989]|uniref:multiple cyclophane-containing RiPP AmcA n=1 Tax=Streptomyces sp. NPDC058989 TaxID=3346686 RepID=UPI0036BAD070